MDSLSLCTLHSSYDQLCIVDQTVKIYIGFVAGEAAPYPPPSDPLLATPDPSRILLPRQRSTGLGKSSSLVPGHHLRFGFGPIIGSNFGWSLFFHQICMAALPPAPLSRRSGQTIVRLKASSWCRLLQGQRRAVGLWPRPSPRAGPLFFQAMPAQNCWMRRTASVSSASLAA